MTEQKFSCPAVSVVIPLYNAEKYIGECLDSLLLQTFQDFEVIVVDDCSTDSSPAVVESYAEKFGGRLKLARMKKKSGGGGSMPRNIGLEISRGKYLYFLDADDAVTPTAFEELYELAEKFSADVVHCEKFYRVPDSIWHNKDLRANLKPDNYFTEGRLNVTAPTVLSDDIAERARMFAERKLIWNYWAQLIRREFIVENSIKLQDAVAQDMILTICELCCAKTYVIVPNAVYNYRVREDSVTTENIDDATRINKWFKCIKFGMEYLDEFFADNERLSNRPDLKYVLFDTFFKKMIEAFDAVYLQRPIYAFSELLQNEFLKDDDTIFMPFIFSAMNVYQVLLKRAQRRIAVLENELNSDRRQLTLAQERIAALETERCRAD